jgi:DnaJ-class molecular chaperone
MKTTTATKLAVSACAAASSSANNQRVLPLPNKLTEKDHQRIAWLHAIPRGGGDNDDKPPSGSSDKKYSKSKKRQNKTGQRQQPKNEKEEQKKEPFLKQTEKSNKQKTAEKKEQPPNQQPINKIVEDILLHDDFYQVLGVSKSSASDREIQKAYRRRAVQTHPDKTGGDRRAFDKVAEAYDVLSDETRKQIYDQYGKRGLEQGAGPMPSSAQDLFNVFRQQRKNQKNQTVRYQLEVTLEDLYKGMTQDIVVTPPGTGRQKKVQVHIPKGSISGQSIVLSGEMDFAEDVHPGDLIFILTQASHRTFTRKGHDLAMEVTISLQEAVCGLRRSIRHLDGHQVVIGSARQDDNAPVLVQTGDVHVLKGQGMPKRNHSNEFGDFYIQYRVEMPKTSKQSSFLTNEERTELGRLLSKLEGKTLSSENKDNDDEDDSNVQYLQTASPLDFGRASGSVTLDEEDQHHDKEEQAHPFRSGFFPQGSSSRSFHFGGGLGGSPFGGSYYGNDDDDSNAQCQQM